MRFGNESTLSVYTRVAFCLFLIRIGSSRAHPRSVFATLTRYFGGIPKLLVPKPALAPVVRYGHRHERSTKCYGQPAHATRGRGSGVLAELFKGTATARPYLGYLIGAPESG